MDLKLLLFIFLTTFLLQESSGKSIFSRRKGGSRVKSTTSRPKQNAPASSSVGGSFGAYYDGSKSGSKPSSQPESQPSSPSGSQPGTIGWNVGNKPSGQDISKTVHTQSEGSKPLGGNGHQDYQPTGNSGQNQQQMGGYNSQNHQQMGGYNSQNHQQMGGYNSQNNQQMGGYNSQNHQQMGGYNSQNHQQTGGYNPVGHQQPYNPSGYQTAGGYGSPGYHYPGGYGQSGGYNPSYGGHSASSHEYNPSVGTPIIVESSSKSGFKEALVQGVGMGVGNAAGNLLVNRIFGGSNNRGSEEKTSGVPTQTQITVNNYYNGPVENSGNQTNQSSVSPSNATAGNDKSATNNSGANNSDANNSNKAATNNSSANNSDKNNSNNSATNNSVANNSSSNNSIANNNSATNNSFDNNASQKANGNSSVSYPLLPEFTTTAFEIQNLTEELLHNEIYNTDHQIKIKLQGQKVNDSLTDDAPEHLLTVSPEAFELATVKKVLALHDNYEININNKENVTLETRQEESDLLDAFLNTEVLMTAMRFLAEKGYIPKEEYEFKDILKSIWFSRFKRIDGDASSSGFETVYLAEQFNYQILGLHNWIYFVKQEEANNLNYLGYIKFKKLATFGAVIKLRSALNNIVQPVNSIFVGTSPELEMALYTVCFYTRPNTLCPVSLGGSQFDLIVNRANYFGKDVLISAYPEI